MSPSGSSSPSTTKFAENALQPKHNLTLLLIDHYDSFTYNLYDMLAQLCEEPPIVLAKDSLEDWSDVEKLYGVNAIDGVVLSPGPGTPTHPEDIGTLSPSIIQKNPDLPILGVCLGHQIMGYVYGATVDLCGPVHGQVRPIEQQQQSAKDPLWKDIPTQFDVTRYHSLAVSLPEETREGLVPLRPTAYSADHGNGQRILMGVSHTENPHYGVQFHPESIGSEYGHQLLRNFCDICKREQVKRQSGGDQASEAAPLPPRPHGHDRYTTEPTSEDVTDSTTPPKSKYQVLVHKVPTTDLSPLEVFEEFLSQEQYSVWLDTSIGIQSATADSSVPTYSSILGAGHNTVEYFGREHDLKDQGLFRHDADKRRSVRVPQHDIFTFLQEEHAHATDTLTMVEFGDDGAIVEIDIGEDGTNLPFDFRGGHVGYLGYDVRHDSERYLEEEENGSRAKWKPLEESLLSPPPPTERKRPKEITPSAAFLFLDKSWVYDHTNDEWYLIGLVKREASNEQNGHSGNEAAVKWMRTTAHRMTELSRREPFAGVEDPPSRSNEAKSSTVRFVPNRSRTCYNKNFADCQEQIRLGESYELCLTNQLEADISLPEQKSPLDLYKTLRKCNPAPFSAFLNWNASSRRGNGNNEGPDASLALCCSSPERFVSVKQKQDRGVTGSQDRANLQVEAKPIKGTCARVIPKDASLGLSSTEAQEDKRRSNELNESVKNRAENLMIVDLLRNDLSRVCEVGTVHVSNLMDIESYATVHQMVSTIRGTLDTENANAVDVLKATFPGGSMTGAPKIRTMEILDRLEEGVSRGPYSGCLGYISMNGSMDMNIVIRSAVLKPRANQSSEEGQHEWKVSIGAGGAITALSESTDEYEEMILKASAVMKAVEEWADAPQSLTLSAAESEASSV